ncbi:hypothetical protein [Gracilimonas sp.]|uniref:InlB B-repeat-containing protein n=1 Tax=Gracilimonas sp. TaxID=1974203 RepID=UPI0032ED3B1A
MSYKSPFLLLLLIIFISCNKENDPTLFSLSVTVVPENSGFIQNFSDTLLKKNTTVELQAVSNEGYAFIDWEGSVSSDDNPLEFTITENTDLVANFEKKSYPLNVTTLGEGDVTETIIKTKTDYEYGTIVQLEAIPDSTWVFEGWEGSVNGEENPVQLTITSEMNVTAVFEEGTINYCVPIKLDGYAHKSSGDSVHFMDYDFQYSDQYLSTYTKYYNYTKAHLDNVDAFIEANYTYQNNLIHQIVENTKTKSGDIWASYKYTLGWNGEQLATLDYEYFVGNQTGDIKSTRIEYEEPCGLRYFEAEGMDAGIRIGFSTEFIYSNNCLTYELTTTDDGIRTYKNQNSIFIDVLGLNGFIGNRYEHMFSFFQPIPLYNKENQRLYKTTSQYINPDEPYIGTSVNYETITENYFYESFIQDQDYPRYFSRIITDTKDDSENKDTFTVSYACQYK